MLRLEGFACGYGAFRAVEGLDLAVPKGEVLALLGANGAGKSSTVMAIAGHVATQGGRLLLQDRDLAGVSAVRRARLGIGLVPEGRRLFPDLSVAENLVVGGYSRTKDQAAAGEARVFALFPRLAERRRQMAGSLSGGEQQMLAIGRALMTEPRLLLIDELSLGLMPKVIDLCYQALSALKAEGLAILLVEQSTTRALAMAERVCVLESGRPVWQGSGTEARGDPKLIDAYLGLADAPATGASC